MNLGCKEFDILGTNNAVTFDTNHELEALQYAEMTAFNVSRSVLFLMLPHLDNFANEVFAF